MSKAKKSSSGAAAVKIRKDLKETQLHPVEGIYCELVDDSDVFHWSIWFQGPGDTPFEGGLFKAKMQFPEDYPMSPPKLFIESEFWHPNVYKKDGQVCISILHSPGNDPTSGEKPEERWSPAQTVSTIMLSFLSLLSDPNFSSPANVDANVDMKDNYPVYLEKVKKLVEKSKQLAPPEIWGLIPHPDTDPIQAQEQKERILRELQPKDDLDWMGYGNDDEEDEAELFDPDGNELLQGYDDEAEDDEDDGAGDDWACSDEGDENPAEQKANEKAGVDESSKKRKRESDDEVDLPGTAKKHKGQN